MADDTGKVMKSGIGVLAWVLAIVIGVPVVGAILLFVFAAFASMGGR